MKMLITCGPSYEPLDEVRRLTNFSTGELGLMIAGDLARDGHEVLCFRGEAATSILRPKGIDLRSFTTNQDLLDQLQELPDPGKFGAIFHTAALCDFKVARVLNNEGTEIRSNKIPSRQGRLSLELEPAPKVIHYLRHLFPDSIITGWKYEMEGGLNNVLKSAERQISESQSNACVLNGRAYGQGFGYYQLGHPVIPLQNKKNLSGFLVRKYTSA